MLGLAWAYAALGELAWVTDIVAGMSAAVVGIVAAALVRIGATRRCAGPPPSSSRSACSWRSSVVGLPFPWVILTAALVGAALGPTTDAVARRAQRDRERTASRGPSRAPRRSSVAGLAIWWLPLLAVAALTGIGSVFAQEGFFFSKVAVVTFGGAYAVLAYVGREMIARFGLTGDDVVAGLSLAETTPGPARSWCSSSSASSPPTGTRAASRRPWPVRSARLVTLWATFVPCFLWIFVGAPYVERLRANRSLRAALAAITAAVVGVIAGLGLTVATLVLFGEVDEVTPFRIAIPVPRLGTLEVSSVLLAVAAFVAIVRFRVNVVWVVLVSAAAGLLLGAVR